MATSNLVAPAVATDSDKPAPRRALLVTYHFSPDRRIGAVRWQRFVPYLVDAGWDVDVITLDPSYLDASQREPNARAALPAGVRVFDVPHPRLRFQRMQVAAKRAVKSLLGRLRRRVDGAAPAASAESNASSTAWNQKAPESTLRRWLWQLKIEQVIWVYRNWERSWAWGVVRVGKQLLTQHAYDVVISSGPPHVAHLAGERLAGHAGAPHVVDLRDPWTAYEGIEDYANGRLARLRDRRDEARVLSNASLIVPVTPAMADDYRAHRPRLADRIHCVMNGADDEPLPPTAHDDRFLLVYAGMIYLDRDPAPLLEALSRVVRALSLTPADIGVHFVGEVEHFGGRPVREIARDHGVEEFLTLSPSRPRRDVLQLYAQAQMLVNLPQASMTQIPAKTFEYVRFASWVLVFAPDGSATETLLRGSGADVVGLHDVDGAAAAIRARYEQHRAGVRPRPLNADDRFSRSTQAAKLLALLDDVMASAPASARRR